MSDARRFRKDDRRNHRGETPRDERSAGRRFTPDEIKALSNDPTKPTRTIITSPEKPPRSWDDQAAEVRRLCDHLLAKLATNIDTLDASTELARLSTIVRAHATKAKDEGEVVVDTR